MTQLTQDLLKQLLSYDPETGVFIRIAAPSPRALRFVGTVAGRVQPRGYREIYIEGRLYLAQRLAVLYMTGVMPLGEVDHINHDVSDNRWANLRDVTASVNQQNQVRAKRTNQTGLLGVSGYASGGYVRWRARLSVDGRERSLGYYRTPEEAHAAYVSAKRVMHPGCTI